MPEQLLNFNKKKDWREPIIHNYKLLIIHC